MKFQFHQLDQFKNGREKEKTVQISKSVQQFMFQRKKNSKNWMIWFGNRLQVQINDFLTFFDDYTSSACKSNRVAK